MSVAFSERVGNLFSALSRKQAEQAATSAKTYRELVDIFWAIETGEGTAEPSPEEIAAILVEAGKTQADLAAELERRQEKAKLINQAATIASLKRDIDELNEAKVKAIAKADAFMARYRAEMAERERQIDALESRRAAAHTSRAKLGEMLPVSEAEAKLAERKKQLLGQLKGGGILVEKNFAARTQQQINEIGRELEELRNRRLDELLIPAAERLTAATAAERELLAQRKKVEESIEDLTARQEQNAELLTRQYNRGVQPIVESEPRALPTQRLAEGLAKKQAELVEIDRQLALVRERRTSAAK